MNRDLPNNEGGNENRGTSMEGRLWDYIDGLAVSGERTVIEKLIADNQAWKEKYDELFELHQLIGHSALEQPSMRFTMNVMEEIAKHQISPAARNYIDKRVIWGIAIFFFTMIAGLLVYGFGQINWTGSGGPVGKYIDLEKIDYSKIFNNTFMNVFLMINAILGLMLLDRYLANKRSKYTGQTGL